MTIKYVPGETTGSVSKWGRFVKWRFYAVDSFSSYPHELDAEDILLNNCNAPSTMIKVPNVSTLMIKPEIAVIPTRIIVKHSYMYNGQYDVKFSTSHTYDFDLQEYSFYSGPLDSQHTKFVGWYVCECSTKYLFKYQGQQTIEEGSPLIKLTFTEDMFTGVHMPLDQSGGGDNYDIYVIAIWETQTEYYNAGICEFLLPNERQVTNLRRGNYPNEWDDVYCTGNKEYDKLGWQPIASIYYYDRISKTTTKPYITFTFYYPDGGRYITRIDKPQTSSDWYTFRYTPKPDLMWLDSELYENLDPYRPEISIDSMQRRRGGTYAIDVLVQTTDRDFNVEYESTR